MPVRYGPLNLKTQKYFEKRERRNLKNYVPAREFNFIRGNRCIYLKTAVLIFSRSILTIRKYFPKNCKNRRLKFALCAEIHPIIPLLTSVDKIVKLSPEKTERKIEIRGNTDMQGKIRRRRKKKRQQGFTLAELIVTVAVMSIVAMIAVPAFQSIAVNGNLKTAAADLASDFALYRQRAMAEYRVYQITVIDGQNYTIEQCANTGSACGGDWELVQNKSLAAIAGDIAFTPEAAVYTFQPRGIITSGTIIITNRRNSRATLNITAAGRTSVSFALQ